MSRHSREGNTTRRGGVQTRLCIGDVVSSRVAVGRVTRKSHSSRNVMRVVVYGRILERPVDRTSRYFFDGLSKISRRHLRRNRRKPCRRSDFRRFSTFRDRTIIVFLRARENVNVHVHHTDSPRVGTFEHNVRTRFARLFSNRIIAKEESKCVCVCVNTSNALLRRRH